MERPYLVYVGGDDQQEIECLYLGNDGEMAQLVFDEAAQDGKNSIVRFCSFPEHSQIRTPMRDGVPPAAKRIETTEKKPAAPSKPKPKPPVVTDVGTNDPEDNGI